jgi:hypothetical protein
MPKNDRSYLLDDANGPGASSTFPSDASAKRKSRRRRTAGAAAAARPKGPPKKKTCGDRINALRKQLKLVDVFCSNWILISSFIYNKGQNELFGFTPQRWMNITALLTYQICVVCAVTVTILAAFPQLNFKRNSIAEMVPTILSQLPIGVTVYPHYAPKASAKELSPEHIKHHAFPYKLVYMTTSDNPRDDDPIHEKMMTAYIASLAQTIRNKTFPEVRVSVGGTPQPSRITSEDASLDEIYKWRYAGTNWQITEIKSDEDFTLRFDDRGNPCAHVSREAIQNNVNRGSMCAYFTFNRVDPFRCRLGGGVDVEIE